VVILVVRRRDGIIPDDYILRVTAARDQPFSVIEFDITADAAAGGANLTFRPWTNWFDWTM
jgi:hypothetical protein